MSEKLRHQLTTVHQNLRLIQEFMPSSVSKSYILLLLQLEVIEICLKLDPTTRLKPIVSNIEDYYYRMMLKQLNQMIRKKDLRLMHLIVKIKHDLADDLVNQKGGCFGHTVKYVHEDTIKIKEKINELIDNQNQTIILFQKLIE